MFLVNEYNLVIASDKIIHTADTVYQVGNTNFFKQGLTLVEMDLPSQYEVGWCTYRNGAFTTVPKPTPEADEQTKQAIKDKLSEINAMCEQAIINGIDVTYAGKTDHYSLTVYDQINVKSLGDMAAQGKNILYHSDNDICRIYTPEEMLLLMNEANKFIVSKITYANLLKQQVQDLINLEEVSIVEFEKTQLNDKYYEIYLQLTEIFHNEE